LIKRFLQLQTLVLILLAAGDALSQTPQLAAREKQWQDYQLPAVEFVRANDDGKTVMFRAPASWWRQPTELSFSGPHSSSIKVFVEKVPDGLPLTDIVAAFTQQLRNQPGAGELLVRRTQMAGLEAREIVFEVPDATGEMSHRVVWCAVNGPHAISFVFLTPAADIAETEPIFKTVIQSVNLPTEAQFAAFESLRDEAIKESRPTRIDEVQRLAGALNGFDLATRRASITRLASVFATSPDAAIDLILNRRALVRASAIEAIGLSRNSTLTEFLFTALEDSEPIVAERAARHIAAMPDGVSRLRSHSLDWQEIEPVARVWAFLSPDRQKEILREIFIPGARPTSARTEPKRSNAPPPPKGVRVLGTVVVNSRPAAGPFQIDPSLQLGGLTLLRLIPASEFPLPLLQVEGTKDETLIRAALEVGLARNEKLPIEPLLSLLSSPNSEITKLAAEHLGNSGSPADIPRIEAQINRQSRAQPQGAAPAKPNAGKTADLALAIKKIRLREQIATAKSDERTAIIKKALSDPQLADWAWANFAHDQSAASANPGESQTTDLAASTPAVSPLAENVLPANVTLYAALPTPYASLNRMSESFNAIQMDTARQQADLVLIMNALRLQLAAQMNAEPGASLDNYLGIDGAAPAVFARWNAEQAPSGIPSAVRHAIFLRVSDRERFERLIGLYQGTAGDIENLPEYLSGGVRFLGMLPGAFPLAARLIVEDSLEKPKDFTILKLGFVGATRWHGYEIKTIEQDRVDSAGHLVHDTAFITYLGETALLTPDLDSLRDLLTRAVATGPTLAANQEFKNAVKSGVDAFYLSNPPELFATSGDRNEVTASESGSLKIANSVWENLFQLKFPESDWAKPLVRFKPAELTAPRELLPATSFAYFITRIDAAQAWTSWGNALNSDERQNFKSIWAGDFEHEVLPELGPECGIAAVGVPNVNKNWDVPLLIYFQLKSHKLQDLFDQGKLFNGKVARPNVIGFRLGTFDVLATIRNGFLVVANSEVALAALDSKDHLAGSADFSKTVKRAPKDLVAFAGLNQDAGVEAITKSVNDPEKQGQMSALLSIAKAFHSQSFYATAESNGIGARFSTLIGREGRYSVAELSALARDQVLTFAIIEPRGVPISNQEQLKQMRLRLRTRTTDAAERLISDVSSATQSVTRKAGDELEVTIQPRRHSPPGKITLPINDPAMAPYLEATRDLRVNDPSVVAKAREIAGNDRDAWSVARKLGQWTFKNLTWKRVDAADPAQTLATREADCSEFSQLYVAMARSLGLPARTVSGLAHSGSAFGGHAWVEVYIDQWIELDPTFGTDFVDATHIRDATGGLLTFAALNLLEIDVLEAPRGVADFQLDPKSLAAKLTQDLAAADPSALTAALDVSLLTDRAMGGGSWAAMNDAEREQMTWAYRRIILEVMTGFTDHAKSRSTDAEKRYDAVRLLQVKQSGESAQALLMHQTIMGDFLEKLTFAKAGDGWFLVEMTQADTGLKIISEMLKPAIWQITDRRNGKTGRSRAATNLVRVLAAMDAAPQTAVKIADEGLKEEPNDRALLYARSLALAHNEKTTGAAMEIWKKLSTDPEPYPAAVLKLAKEWRFANKEEERAEARALFEKYVALEPGDPRGHRHLAQLYNEAKKFAEAEAEYRAALAADPGNTDVYTDLAEFLAAQKRYPEAVTVINDAAARAPAGEDVLGQLFQSLVIGNNTDDAENLARLMPAMMNKSSEANLNLGQMRMHSNRAAQAVPLLRRAAELDPKSPVPWSTLAECYRQLKNWAAAYSAATTAIARDAKDPEAFYQLACAEARLGRPKDALASLKRSIELEPMMADGIEDELDLKSLSSLPEFKKLLANREQQ